MIPEALSFNMDSSNYTATFPANCGMGIVNTSSAKSYTAATKTIFCLECSPGYSKIVDNTTFVTTSCV